MYLLTFHNIYKTENQQKRILFECLILVVGLEQSKQMQNHIYSKQNTIINTNRMGNSIVLQTLYIYKWVSPLS